MMEPRGGLGSSLPCAHDGLILIGRLTVSFEFSCAPRISRDATGCATFHLDVSRETVRGIETRVVCAEVTVTSFIDRRYASEVSGGLFHVKHGDPLVPEVASKVATWLPMAAFAYIEQSCVSRETYEQIRKLRGVWAVWQGLG